MAGGEMMTEKRKNKSIFEGKCCPFCGSKKITAQSEWGSGFEGHFMECEECYCRGPMEVEGGKVEAMTSWNKRA
jgi:hypothetical protein